MANSSSIHEVRWQEVCPWLILVPAVRTALMVRVVALALAGAALTQAGWSVMEFVAGPIGIPDRDERIPPNPSARAAPSGPWGPALTSSGAKLVQSNPLYRVWAWPTQRLTRLGDRASWQAAVNSCLAVAWAIAVWGIFGGAAARIAAVRLTRGETLAVTTAIRDATRAWPSTAGAPVVTCIGLVIMSAPLLIAGLLMRFALPAVCIGLLWGVVLVLGLGVVVALVGLIVGWPFMWASGAVERTDAYDGVSRAFAYVYQRPLHLVWHLAAAAALAAVADFVVHSAVEAAVMTSEGLVGLGAGSEQAAQFFSEERDAASWASAAIRWWNNALRGAAEAFPLALLWPLATGIYLLQRQQIDDTELDECSLERDDV